MGGRATCDSFFYRGQSVKMAVFALVDCNNFFVSCERAFNPRLKNQPVIVLSSNDGCVVARSNEAKALGIQMGVPYYQVKALVEKAKVTVLSSNFALYSDMSSRTMSLLAESAPEIEVYSIDEAFLRLDGLPHLKRHSQRIRQHILQCTGIPVSIGVGPTKTIAKLANFIAKNHTQTGVYGLIDEKIRARAYAKIPVHDIWGIGRQSSARLNALGIVTIADFVRFDPQRVRANLGLHGLKTQKELQGHSCIDLEEIDPPAKSMTSSRSFGRPVTDLEDLRAAITLHISKMAARLREKKLATRELCIYAHSNRFNKGHEPWNFSCMVSLPWPSNSTGPLLTIALRGIESLYKQGILYKKTGVLAPDLVAEGFYAPDLFTPEENPKQQKLSQLMDEINAQFGGMQLFHGSLGAHQDWLPKNHLRSPHYTTSLREVLEVF